MVEFVEETFDQVPLLVRVAVIFPLFFAVLAGWDHRFGFFTRNLLQEIIHIIRAIRNDPFKIEIDFSGKVLPRHEIVTIEYRIPDDSEREHDE
jgi:hypothetical protein